MKIKGTNVLGISYQTTAKVGERINARVALLGKLFRCSGPSIEIYMSMIMNYQVVY